MKQPFIALFIYLFVGQNIYAQFKDTGKAKVPFSVAFISLNIGTGLPLGDFKTTGLAQPGFTTSLTAATTVDDSVVGYIVRINYGVNNVDKNAFVKELNSYNYGYSSNILSLGSYSYASVLNGIYFAGCSCRKFGFNINVIAGYLLTSTPNLSVSAYGNGNSSLIGLSNSVSGALCYGGGVGFNYVITKRFTLFLDADYMHSSPSHHVIESSQSVNPSPGYLIETMKTVTQPFSLTTVTLGIGFKIPAMHFYN